MLDCGGLPTTLWEIRAVTKKEIVKDISEEIGLTQLKTKEIVQKTFDAIVKTLVEDGRIELRNFGVFEVKKRAARKARNPRTGDKVFVPEKFVVTFKPGKEMEERVRQLEEEAARKAMQGEQMRTESPPPASHPSPTPSTNPGFPQNTMNGQNPTGTEYQGSQNFPPTASPAPATPTPLGSNESHVSEGSHSPSHG